MKTRSFLGHENEVKAGCHQYRDTRKILYNYTFLSFLTILPLLLTQRGVKETNLKFT